jgi:hypothetical protein
MYGCIHKIAMLLRFIINYVIIVGLIILMLRVIRRITDQIAIHDTRDRNSLSKDIHIRGHRCEKNDTFRL